MNGRFPTAYFLSFLLLLFSCHYKQKQVIRSCYYWSDYPDAGYTAFLKEHAVRKLYAKLLDIDWKDVYGAYPVVSTNIGELDIRLNTYDSLHIEIVPVVFITNQAFTRINKKDIPLLAKRIVRRCLPGYDSTDKEYESRHSPYYDRSRYKPLMPLREIQFDCDWTLSTAEKYFYFLQVVRLLLPPASISISATIRLHQYKYFGKTGVPPVNRGMLMMYNVNDLRQHTALNSIFDYNKAKAYFTTDQYPLPLDVVLPAYSWCVIFRNNQFMQLSYDVAENDLKQSAFLDSIGNNFYRIKQDTVFHDLFLRTGDEIKLERINDETLQQAATLSRRALNADTVSIALFELSSPEIQRYKYETIEKVYASFR